MDYQVIADSFSAMTCIISVEKKENGAYGDIRIVTGNKPYIKSIEDVSEGPQMLTNKFIPNQTYEHYFPKDLNFEDFCYRSAVLKQPLHSYVHPERFDFWFNLFFMPLESDDENIGYCAYTQELSHEASTEKMAGTSYETASDVLQTCIKLRETSDFKKTMKEIVNDIREICKAHYCGILLFDFIERRCSLLGESMAGQPDFKTDDKVLNEDFYENAINWEVLINGSNCLILKNENDMKFIKEKDENWYNSLKNAGVNSLILFPLRANDELLGYIWVTNFDTEKTVRIKETLELSTFFLAAEISNHQLFDRFRILSSIDMLTGVLNRNEMNNRVDTLSTDKKAKKQNVGIDFADVNGLKQTNDLQGHEEGDKLLKKSADMMSSVFADDEIYRAGGDEFMVMVLGKEKAEFEEKVLKLRKLVKNNTSVNFAIGACFETDSRNVCDAMKNADALMYEDKKLYYQKHPEKKRK